MTSDPNEMASEEEEMTRMASLHNHKFRQEKAPQDWDGLHCIEESCDLDVEVERIKHGFFRCFQCQSDKEAKIKRMRGIK